MNKAVYIIGSYAPCEGRSESTNVTRAVALGSLALATGHVPIIPHLTIGCSSILLGRFTPAVDADGLAREASYGKNGTGGLAAMLRDSMISMDVSLWVILKDDGSMSSGTKAEYDEFTLDPIGVGAVALTWKDWGPRFADAGLGNLYTEISKPITGFQRWPNDEGPFIYLNLPGAQALADEVRTARATALDELIALSEEVGYHELDDVIERKPKEPPPKLNVSKIAIGLHADLVKCLSCGITTHRKVGGGLVQVCKHLDTCAKVQGEQRSDGAFCSLRSMLLALKEKTGRSLDLCEKAVRATYSLMYWDYETDSEMVLGSYDPNYPLPAAMEPHALLWIQENAP